MSHQPVKQVGRRRVLRWAAAAAATSALSFGAVAMAQQPPIRILVGFPPGGTTDVIARMIATELGSRLQRNVIVENRPGASGSIAAGVAAKAAPDGNTLLFAPSSHATNVTLYPQQPFDTVRDLPAIGLVATTPYVLVVNPALSITTVPDFISYLKANPGQVNYASASPGTGQHLAAELFKSAAQVDMLHVPYRGSAAALPDLLAGRTPVMFDNIAVMTPHIKAGSVRALAVTAGKRSPLLPGAPTIAESGLPSYDISGWFGLFGPANVPPDIVRDISVALNAAASDPALKQRLAELGAETVTSTPEDANAFVEEEIDRWRKVIQEAGITIE